MKQKTNKGFDNLNFSMGISIVIFFLSLFFFLSIFTYSVEQAYTCILELLMEWKDGTANPCFYVTILAIIFARNEIIIFYWKRQYQHFGHNLRFPVFVLLTNQQTLYHPPQHKKFEVYEYQKQAAQAWLKK